MCLNLRARHLDCQRFSLYYLDYSIGESLYCFALKTVPLSITDTTFLVEKEEEGLNC